MKSRSIRDELFRSAWLDDVPVVSPVLALMTSARTLSLEDAAVMLESLLATSNVYPRLRFASRPHLTPEDLDPLLATFRGVEGVGLIRDARALVRPHVESPMETVARLRLMTAGLPEPEIQCEITLPNGDTYRSDLGYRHAKTLIDYEGEHHILDRQTFANDLVRSRNLQDLGFRHYRITVKDLTGARLRELVASITRHPAIASN